MDKQTDRLQYSKKLHYAIKHEKNSTGIKIIANELKVFNFVLVFGGGSWTS